MRYLMYPLTVEVDVSDVQEHSTASMRGEANPGLISRWMSGRRVE